MKDHLLQTIEKSRKYTLEVAEAMPEVSYMFKPKNAGWDFGNLLHHIAYGINWWKENYINGVQVEWEQPVFKGGKKEIINYLKESYQSLQASIKEHTPTESVVNGLHATLDHVTHHRGQAVVYLRCNGIAPPEYTY
jgi:uncharacterized damage-inducible protein DinB